MPQPLPGDAHQKLALGQPLDLLFHIGQHRTGRRRAERFPAPAGGMVGIGQCRQPGSDLTGGFSDPPRSLRTQRFERRPRPHQRFPFHERFAGQQADERPLKLRGRHNRGQPQFGVVQSRQMPHLGAEFLQLRQRVEPHQPALRGGGGRGWIGKQPRCDRIAEIDQRGKLRDPHPAANPHHLFGQRFDLKGSHAFTRPIRVGSFRRFGHLRDFDPHLPLGILDTAALGDHLAGVIDDADQELEVRFQFLAGEVRRRHRHFGVA